MSTLADRNNNPGNIKDTSTGQFKIYGSPQEGYAALMNDLEIKKSGRSKTGLRPDQTLADFSNVYAPSSDKNDPAQYTSNLANHMGVRPDAQIKDLDIGRWADAIANAEGYTKAVKSQPTTPSQTQPTTQPATQPEVPEEKGGATFKSSPTDTPFKAGAKTLGNIPRSAWNFTKGIVSALNPLNTLKTISEIGPAYRALKEEGGSAKDAVKELPKATYEGLVPQGFRQVIAGDIEGAQKTFTEDPIGTVAPVVLSAAGGVKALKKGEIAKNKSATADYVREPFGKTQIPKSKQTWQNVDKAMEKGISQTAGLITKPLGSVGSKIGSAVSTIGRSAISQLTAMAPETISTILRNPKEFSKMAMEEISRGGLAGEIKSKIKERLADLKETGKGYDAIRNSNQTITMKPNFISESLVEHGLKIKKGKIVADTKSSTRNASDIRALQKFYDDWGGKPNLTPSEFLNMRADLADLARYDKLTGMGKSKVSETIGKGMRDKLNKEVRDSQIQELKALDDTYAPERQFLGQVFKDYFKSDGTFKDGAASRIANAGNKAELLKRLEGVVPGITKRIEILKAVEDIQSANGIKVGTYTRGILGGMAITGNVGAIVGMIIAHPSNAVKIIRTAGVTGGALTSVISALKVVGGDVQIPNSSKVTGIYQKNPQLIE